MTDLEMWMLGVSAVEKEFMTLPSTFLVSVKERAKAIKRCKKAIHSFAEAMNGREVCALCRGECCITGKYHFTVIDLLVFLASERQLFEPRFEQGLCPYLGGNGCLMEPEYRPFNCITFNCERVEGLMEPLEIERFHLIEQELIVMYKELERLFGNRFTYGLLINCERDLIREKTSILRTTM